MYPKQKKNKTKKIKAITVSKAKEKAWKAFSYYIRTRDCLKTTGTTTHGNCYTCGRYYAFGQLQAGHFLPGRHPINLFDFKGVHAQCYHCNVGLKGNWVEYIKKMREEYGVEFVEEMLAHKHEIKQFSVPELEELYELFVDMAVEL